MLANKDNEQDDDVLEYVDKSRHMRLIEVAVPYYNIVGYLTSEGYEDKDAEKVLKEAIMDGDVGELSRRADAYEQRRANRIFDKWDEIPEINLRHRLVTDLVKKQGESYEDAQIIAHNSIENGTSEDILSSQKGFVESIMNRRKSSTEEECNFCHIL